MIDPDVYRAVLTQTAALLDWLTRDRKNEVEAWADETGDDEHPARLLREAMGRLDDALVVFEDAVEMALLEAAL